MVLPAWWDDRSLGAPRQFGPSAPTKGFVPTPWNPSPDFVRWAVPPQSPPRGARAADGFFQNPGRVRFWTKLVQNRPVLTLQIGRGDPPPIFWKKIDDFFRPGGPDPQKTAVFFRPGGPKSTIFDQKSTILGGSGPPDFDAKSFCSRTDFEIFDENFKIFVQIDDIIFWDPQKIVGIDLFSDNCPVKKGGFGNSWGEPTRPRNFPGGPSYGRWGKNAILKMAQIFSAVFGPPKKPFFWGSFFFIFFLPSQKKKIKKKFLAPSAEDKAR